jgi:hypothetical protein
MAQESIQPLAEMSTRDLPARRGRLWAEKMWQPRRLTTLWAFTACYRDSFFYNKGKLGKLSRYRDELDGRSSIPSRGKEIFVYSTASRPALGPTQPPTRRIREAFLSEVEQTGREADHHFHLVSRSRMVHPYFIILNGVMA